MWCEVVDMVLSSVLFGTPAPYWLSVTYGVVVFVSMYSFASILFLIPNVMHVLILYINGRRLRRGSVFYFTPIRLIVPIVLPHFIYFSIGDASFLGVQYAYLGASVVLSLYLSLYYSTSFIHIDGSVMTVYKGMLFGGLLVVDMEDRKAKTIQMDHLFFRYATQFMVYANNKKKWVRLDPVYLISLIKKKSPIYFSDI